MIIIGVLMVKRPNDYFSSMVQLMFDTGNQNICERIVEQATSLSLSG